MQTSQSLVAANPFVVYNWSLTIVGSYKVTLPYGAWSITTIKVAIRPGNYLGVQYRRLENSINFGHSWPKGEYQWMLWNCLWPQLECRIIVLYIDRDNAKTIVVVSKRCMHLIPYWLNYIFYCLLWGAQYIYFKNKTNKGCILMNICKTIYQLRGTGAHSLRPFLATNTILSVLPVCSLHVHM